jgi:large subunit ribosomal protein L23
MALFSRSKKTTDEGAAASVAKAISKARATDRDLASVIIAPVITEKAVLQQGRQVYAFFVRKDATKYLVRDAVIALYKVTPVSINIVNKVPRTTMSRARGREVKVSGYKKAYVYLKAGDSISIA